MNNDFHNRLTEEELQRRIDRLRVIHGGQGRRNLDQGFRMTPAAWTFIAYVAALVTLVSVVFAPLLGD